jgi:hypothetical protein
MTKRLAGLLLTLMATLALVACSPLEQQARNTAAALQGAIGAAQAQYQTTCTANPSQTACTVINQAVAGQNALVTAAEAYCGWSTAAPPAVTTATCVPVKSAQAGLQTAINNANLFVTELKGVIK